MRSTDEAFSINLLPWQCHKNDRLLSPRELMLVNRGSKGYKK